MAGHVHNEHVSEQAVELAISTLVAYAHVVGKDVRFDVNSVTVEEIGHLGGPWTIRVGKRA